ncbi:putative ribonuclease H-like domain-containing protein [Tanacetum coccineum]
MKGIKREFSVARTPQQNGVAERRNRTLIKAARTMLVDSKLLTTFWAEAVNTACYVLNRVLVIKPHTKTPYELIHGRTPLIDFMKPFGCPVTILNTRDHLGKFDEKADDGFFVGYSVELEIILLQVKLKRRQNLNKMHESGASDKGEEDEQDTRSEFERLLQQEKQTNSTNSFNTVGTPVSAVGPSFTNDDPSSPVNAAEASNAFEDHLFEQFYPFKNAFALPHVLNMFSIDDTVIFGNAYDDEDVGAEADLNNLETTMNVSPIPTTRIDKDHPKDQIIRDLNSAIQTRRMTKISDEHAMVSYINKQRRTNHKDYQNCLFACFLSQKEPKKVFRNKKDERGIVVRNKARLVAQGYTQEEGINYDEVFALVARIEAIRLFLAYASYMGFIVYQMDVKSAFLYGTIKEEVYVCQPLGFEDPHFPDKVYKVEKALYGLHQAPRAWYETLSTYLIENGFRRGTIDKTSFIKKDKGDILLVHVYVDDIIFGSTKKSLYDEFEGLMHKRFHMSSMGELTFFLCLQTTSTPIETNKALVKDEEDEVVDVHLYRSMIGSLMYLTASRPDIMFAVCACARFQVTPKTSHIHVVERIFRYLKGQPKLGLWYLRDSSFDLEAFSDSDYAGASLDRKSTIGEYVAAANCCSQVLWIQNQMLDYGFNFMNTKIYIDNESTICIVKNPVFHSKTKHIEIRHHFIRDYYEKKLIQVIKIHTDHNVAYLLIKAFDVRRMERAATTASSLEVEQDSGSGPRCQDTILGGVEAQSRFEAASKQSNDTPLSRVNTLGSGEDSMKLMELMEHCTTLSELVSLKKRCVI